MAEEALLGQILREPALLDQVDLAPEEFSCELLGRCYGQLREQHRQGLQVRLAALENLTPEEMAHLAGIAQKQQGPVSEGAMRDYVDTIREERRLSQAKGPEGLMAIRDAMRAKKGYGG